VPVWKRDDGMLIVDDVTIIVPPRDGSRTRYQTVWDVAERLNDKFSHPTFVIDPEMDGEQLAQQMEDELNAEVTTYSQKNTPMALAAQRLSEAISSSRIRHPGIFELTRHVLAASPRQVGEMWKLGKPRRSGAKIDAAVALAMAVSVACHDQPSVYESRGVLAV
jgi:phage terminase large subunit-like protein